MKTIILVMTLIVFSCAQTITIKFPVKHNGEFLFFLEEVEDTLQSVIFPIDSLLNAPDEEWAQFMIDRIYGDSITMFDDTTGIIEYTVGLNTQGENIWLATAIFIRTDGGTYSNGTGELKVVEKKPNRVGWIKIEVKKPLWKIFWDLF